MFNTHPRPNASRIRKPALIAGLITAVAMLASACTGTATNGDAAASGSADRPLTVLTSFYPLQFVASEVAGDRANVINLTPPAADPHDLELSMAAANQINTADVVVTLGGFQPAVDQAIDARNPARVVDAAHYVDLLPASGGGHNHDDDDDHAHDDGHDHDDEADHSHDDDHYDEGHDDDGHGHGHSHDIGGYDPHFWLDPIRLGSLAEPIANALSEAEPEYADYFHANAANLVERLAELDAEFKAGLAPFAGAKLVTSHEAFAYLANRYGLTQVGIAGIDPDIEPSPARLREIAEIARANNVSTIFYETLISPRVAQTLASDLGINAAVLHTAEGLTTAEQNAGENYFTIMRANLATLKEHLQ